MPVVLKRELSLFDLTCIIVGIIGAGIYQMAPDIAKDVWCFYDPHSF